MGFDWSSLINQSLTWVEVLTGPGSGGGGAGGWSWTTRTFASRPARPSSTAPCPSEGTSTWWGTWTQVSPPPPPRPPHPPVTTCVRLFAGTHFDYIREFRRSTGRWHRTMPMLPSDLSKPACAALRFANCRLFHLQLRQGTFRLRV